MKVVLVLEQFDWRKGGLESWTWQFARLLKRRGCEAHAVAFGFHPDSERETGIIPHRLGRPRSRLQRAEALEQHLRTLKADVIHDMGVGWHADVFHPHGGSIIATREHNLLRIPKWRRLPSFLLPKRQRDLLEIERRQHARPGAVIVAVSNMVKSHFETMNRLPVEKIRVIYNGVDLEKFSPANREKFRAATRAGLGLKNETLFFLLAHNLRLKNAATLIRAMAELAGKNKPAHLVIAGNDRTGPYVRLAVKSGVAGRVTFLGLVDAARYYAAADVCVLPTWYDPCSLFTLEAWASGLPVITTRCNGASALMTEGLHGYTLPDPADHAAFASRMEALLDEPVRAKMSESARDLALQHSFERQADEFIALYEEVKHAKR